MLGAELGPQPPDVHVHRASAAEVVVSPDLLQQLGPGEDPAGMLGKELEQLEFLEGQVQDPAAQPGRVGGLVDGQLADRISSGGLHDRGYGPAADGEPDPGLHLGGTGYVQDHVIRAHSALTAARPPSVTMANNGQSRPVVLSSLHMLFACARSRRASTSTVSAGAA